MKRYTFVLGLLAGVPMAASAAPPVAEAEGPPVVVAEDQQEDVLMHPSRDMAGAQRLGSVEIANPPHESFGVQQKPSGPDENELRWGPTGVPVTTGAQAKANAAALRAQRATNASDARGLEAPSPAVAEKQAAAAQAAGVQAAISSAKTSQAAAAAEPAADTVPPAAPPASTDEGRTAPAEQAKPLEATPPAGGIPDAGPSGGGVPEER